MYDAGRIILEESKSQNDLSDSTSQVGLIKNRKSGGNVISTSFKNESSRNSKISQELSEIQQQL